MYIYGVFLKFYYSIKCLKKLFPPLYKEVAGWVILKLALKDIVLGKFAGPFQCGNFEGILIEEEEEEEKGLGSVLFLGNH